MVRGRPPGSKNKNPSKKSKVKEILPDSLSNWDNFPYCIDALVYSWAVLEKEFIERRSRNGMLFLFESLYEDTSRTHLDRLEQNATEESFQMLRETVPDFSWNDEQCIEKIDSLKEEYMNIKDTLRKKGGVGNDLVKKFSWFDTFDEIAVTLEHVVSMGRFAFLNVEDEDEKVASSEESEYDDGKEYSEFNNDENEVDLQNFDASRNSERQATAGKKVSAKALTKVATKQPRTAEDIKIQTSMQNILLPENIRPAVEFTEQNSAKIDKLRPTAVTNFSNSAAILAPSNSIVSKNEGSDFKRFMEVYLDSKAADKKDFQNQQNEKLIFEKQKLEQERKLRDLENKRMELEIRRMELEEKRLESQTKMLLALINSIPITN